MFVLRQFDTDELVDGIFCGARIKLPLRRASLAELLDIRRELLDEQNKLTSWWRKLIGTDEHRLMAIGRELDEIDHALSSFYCEWTIK